MDLIKNLDVLLQIVCDKENQPHQFIGDEKGLKEAFKVKGCSCVEPPSKPDVIITVCGECNNIVTLEE